jgi:hypothetical protein
MLGSVMMNSDSSRVQRRFMVVFLVDFLCGGLDSKVEEFSHAIGNLQSLH